MSRTLGRYRLIRHLGQGGMAEVWLAESESGRRVVVKEMRERLARDADLVKLFLREAEIATRLAHGNIAQVFDFGEADGRYFLVMERVDGFDLAELAHRSLEKERPIPDVLAALVVARVASALDHAHHLHDESGAPLGIVHRDVTPHNVMLTRGGETKLLDFGVARRADDRDLTRPGVTRGKVAYFSPEQVRARPLDGRSDLFACGVVLFELLTGQRPFAGKGMEALTNIVEGRRRSLRELRPDLAPELEAIVERCLATEPAARHQRGAELEQALLEHVRSIDPRLSDADVARWLKQVVGGGVSATADAAPVARRRMPLLLGLGALVLAGVAVAAWPLLRGESPGAMRAPPRMTDLVPPPPTGDESGPEPTPVDEVASHGPKRPPSPDPIGPLRKVRWRPPADARRVHASEVLLEPPEAGCIDFKPRKDIRIRVRGGDASLGMQEFIGVQVDAVFFLVSSGLMVDTGVVPVSAEWTTVPGWWRRLCIFIADTRTDDNTGHLVIEVAPGRRKRVTVGEISIDVRGRSANFDYQRSSLAGAPAPDLTVMADASRRTVRGKALYLLARHFVEHFDELTEAVAARRYSNDIGVIDIDGPPIPIPKVDRFWMFVPDERLLGGRQSLAVSDREGASARVRVAGRSLHAEPGDDTCVDTDPARDLRLAVRADAEGFVVGRWQRRAVHGDFVGYVATRPDGEVGGVLGLGDSPVDLGEGFERVCVLLYQRSPDASAGGVVLEVQGEAFPVAAEDLALYATEVGVSIETPDRRPFAVSVSNHSALDGVPIFYFAWRPVEAGGTRVSEWSGMLRSGDEPVLLPGAEGHSFVMVGWREMRDEVFTFTRHPRAEESPALGRRRRWRAP